jgi:hypothetical protein
MAIYSNSGLQIRPGWNNGLRKSSFYPWAVITSNDCGDGYKGKVIQRFHCQWEANRWIEECEQEWRSDFEVIKFR